MIEMGKGMGLTDNRELVSIKCAVTTLKTFTYDDAIDVNEIY